MSVVEPLSVSDVELQVLASALNRYNGHLRSQSRNAASKGRVHIVERTERELGRVSRLQRYLGGVAKDRGIELVREPKQ